MRPTSNVIVRPSYGVGDIIGLLFRELLLMIAIFLVIFAIGAAVVMTMKKTYTAYASVYAGVGQEYVYQPRVGLAERGQAPNADQVARSEAAIMGSLEVKRRALRVLGAETVLGEDAADMTSGERETAALKVLDSGLEVGAAPGSAVVALSFESTDPLLAARALNAIVDQYLIYRRELFQDRQSSAIAEQREAFQLDLGRADEAYQAFLESNEIGDFVTAKATVAATYQTTYAERLSLRAQLDQAGQRLATLQAQLAQTPAEVVLQQDLNVQAIDQIRQLRTERENLLARYTPEAQPVRDIEERIMQLEAYVAGENTVGPRDVRTGPNQIWTEIETQRINAAADRDALAARLAVVDQQLGQLRERLGRLTELESTNASLGGNREVLTAQVRDFQLRESQARAEGALIAAGADAVNVIERATPPSEGKSLKIPLLAAVLLFAGFTALCVGLLRVFTRRGFVTAGSVSRTLGLPVLAVAPVKAG